MALFRAALMASCFRGALSPVDLPTVCLVRVIPKHLTRNSNENQTGFFFRMIFLMKFHLEIDSSVLKDKLTSWVMLRIHSDIEFQWADT